MPLLDPAEVAASTVREMIEEGAKTHPASSWRDDPEDMHLDKAVRHIMTFKLIRDGNQNPDGEMHLKNAITRLSMALCQALDMAQAE